MPNIYNNVYEWYLKYLSSNILYVYALFSKDGYLVQKVSSSCG